MALAGDRRRDEEAWAYLGMSIADATRKLLESKKRAMGTSGIVAAITAGGLAMASADPINTVSTVLGRRSEKVGDIVRLERGKWGLKGGEAKPSTRAPEPPSAPTLDADPE
jgi:HB1, ASXL, restriction endonuclease HTH domain